MERKKITFDLVIRSAVGIALAVGILMLLHRLSSVLVPFFLAWLLAYLIFPLVKWFQYKLRFKYRAVAIFAALFTITLVLALLIWALAPPIAEEFSKVKELVYIYFTNNEVASRIPTVVNQFIQEHIGTDQIMKMLDKQEFQQMVREALPRLWSVVTQSISIMFSLFSLVMVALYTIFILLDYEAISDGWPELVPHRYRAFCVKILNDVNDSMNKYFRGQALVAFCVGVLFSIGFLIVGMPLAIPLGLFIGLLNMVPYLQIVGFIPTIALAVIKAADTGSNLWVILLACLVVFAVVQAIQDLFLTPKIMGQVTGLNPAIILLSLSIWGSLMGVLGMIIALPITTLLISYYQKYIINHEHWNAPPIDLFDDTSSTSGEKAIDDKTTKKSVTKK